VSTVKETTNQVLAPYGQFSESGRQYILYDPHTPRSWQNLMSNDDYLLALTQWASGYSVYKGIHVNTVTPATWPDDNTGRFFYLRDGDCEQVWSPTVWPAHSDLNEVSDYRCTYGLGYTTWELTRLQVRSKLTAAVALDDCVELYLLELTNLTSKPRRLDVFCCLQWSFKGAPTELGAALLSYFDDTLQCQIGDLQVPPQYRAKQTGFLTCNRPIIGYDGDAAGFLGRPGNVTRPAAVTRGECSNKPGPILGISCGAIHFRMDLPANGGLEAAVIVGVVDRKDEIGALRQRYLHVQAIRDELAAIEAHWQERLAGPEISSPNGDLDRFANTWLKYQLWQNVRWCRWAGHKGYRDVLQDAAAVRLMDPSRARQTITTAAGKQLSSGHAPRQWRITSWDEHDWRDYRDSCFWLIFALEKYLKETGDHDFLNVQIPFIDADEPATVFEHAHRAVDFLFQNRGRHGLCLIGRGDWLDSLNAAGTAGKGESVWLTQAACYALRQMQQIARLLGYGRRADAYRSWRHELADAVNAAGWDGRWYVTAYNDIGEPIGSAGCPDGGRIFLNPQSWAVLSQTATGQRGETAMAAVDELLLTRYGYLCFAPRYTQFDPHIGRICLWPSEGASVYCHAVLFKIVADCLMGEGDRAWNTLKLITPALNDSIVANSGAEPFCYPNSYAGPDWPHPGRSYTGWWTGTAGWALQALAEWIFGARAEWEGLLIDPCLPKAWTAARIKRPFRGCLYDITITKPDSLSKGRVTLTVDGQALEGNLITPFADGRTHQVHCEIR